MGLLWSVGGGVGVLVVLWGVLGAFGGGCVVVLLVVGLGVVIHGLLKMWGRSDGRGLELLGGQKRAWKNGGLVFK